MDGISMGKVQLGPLVQMD